MPASKQVPVFNNPSYRFLVWIVICLAAASLAVWCWMANVSGDHPNKIQERIADGCETIFKMAAGALGGRAGAPDRVDIFDAPARPVLWLPIH